MPKPSQSKEGLADSFKGSKNLAYEAQAINFVVSFTCKLLA